MEGGVKVGGGEKEKVGGAVQQVNGGLTNDGLSAIMPGWFSEINPMWPGRAPFIWNRFDSPASGCVLFGLRFLLSFWLAKHCWVWERSACNRSYESEGDADLHTSFVTLFFALKILRLLFQDSVFVVCFYLEFVVCFFI